MVNEIKVIVSPNKPHRVASVIGKEIFYDTLAEGESLVTHEGFSGKYKPAFVKDVWIETATAEEIAEIESKIVRPKIPLTADQLIDVLKFNGVQVWPL